ncbi:MAG: hypothetical protein JNJ98_19340 [Gemmatimonadetes bacterium]|nr:hypothetical protein [Gemmatimonadota bacterium]
MANTTMRPQPSPEEQLLPTIEQAFSRVHKAAFGAAVGAAGALVMGSLTLIVLLRPAAANFPLHLMNEYFAGYSVSWPGVFVGMAWGFAVAFVAGWFLAFCRNLSVAVSAFFIRTRAEIEQTRTFLDHI